MTNLKTHTGTEADFFKRGRAIAQAADAGAPIPETHLLTFEDPAEMMAIFTPKRVQLVKAIQEQADSITALAVRVHRDRGSVSKDLAVLKNAGVVNLFERTHPGHGMIKVVSMVAKRIQLSVVI